MTSLSRHIDFARRMVTVMDLRFSIFGVKFGIDPLLDIIPGLGNVIASSVSCYLFWIAWKLKVPLRIYIHMIWNIGVDYMFGLVPFIGFIADVFFRSNVRNLALVESCVNSGVEIGEVIG